MTKLRGRILVVDDEKTNRLLLEMGLKKQGHTVVLAENGRVALDILRQQPIDLVLLDIVMPEVNGFQVLATMKKESDLSDIPVIVISAMEQMASVVKCIELGAEDHLPKPFEPALLQARINAGLQKKRYRDQEIEYLHQVSLITNAATAYERREFTTGLLRPVVERQDSLGTLSRVLRKMAIAMIAREEELERDNQIKAAFIDVISHELRSPFASAAMSLELLKRYAEHEMYDESNEQIEQLTEELTQGRRLIETIISFADQMGKELELILQETDMADLIRETAVSLQKMADSRQIQLSVQITEPLPVLRVDRKRVAEALHHLMHNALKFTGENGRVTVKCRQKNTHLVVQVQDNGKGIPEVKLAEIWEPFGQESGRVQRGVEGLGLGLPLVKAIIQAHQGRVGAASEPGKGSNFYFALPK